MGGNIFKDHPQMVGLWPHQLVGGSSNWRLSLCCLGHVHMDDPPNWCSRGCKCEETWMATGSWENFRFHLDVYTHYIHIIYIYTYLFILSNMCIYIYRDVFYVLLLPVKMHTHRCIYEGGMRTYTHTLVDMRKRIGYQAPLWIMSLQTRALSHLAGTRLLSWGLAAKQQGCCMMLLSKTQIDSSHHQSHLQLHWGDNHHAGKGGYCRSISWRLLAGCLGEAAPPLSKEAIFRMVIFFSSRS